MSAGKAITLMISNEDMNDISRIIDWQSFTNLKNHETKRQEYGFLGILLRTLGTSTLENV